MTYVWDSTAWEDCLYWQEQDRRTLKRVNCLVKDIARGAHDGRPNEGIGKPEALKHGLHGYWSRRISDEHRLIYKVVDDEIRVAACRYHYED
jgi:toxin YoeB